MNHLPSAPHTASMHCHPLDMILEDLSPLSEGVVFNESFGRRRFWNRFCEIECNNVAM